MIAGPVHGRCFAGLIFIALGIVYLSDPARATGMPSRCTCSDGRSLQTGAVSYSDNSDRETITKIETEDESANSPCRAIWVTSTQIRPRGNPYEFVLQRFTLS